MTFQEYINNPTGVGNSVMSYRSMYEDLYHNKWDKIMVRENGKIDYKLYYSKNHYYSPLLCFVPTISNRHRHFKRHAKICC